MFQYMNYVYEVYKTGSFSKAARNLYLTQPALSIAIKKEEQELGQPLFDRSTSRVTLTEAGKAYIESAETIRSLESGMRLYCSDLSGLRTGSVQFLSLPDRASRHRRIFRSLPGNRAGDLRGPFPGAQREAS